MEIYFNTRYNTELTLESDNVHHLLEAMIDTRHLVNADSYLGFNSYLNGSCEDCIGSVRTQDNTLIYILEGFIYEDEQRYYVQAVEHKEGVQFSVHTKDKSEFIYNRLTKAVA